MPSTRLLSRLALGTTLVLVTIGGYTRGSGSGYGCEDRWPLCENGLLGGLLPRIEFHMIVEWTHRWVAATVGLLAIATAYAAWRNYRDRLAVLLPAVAAVLVIGLQAWIGRLVVKGNLDADLVSIHLAISMVVVGLLTIVAVATTPGMLSGGRPGYADSAWTGLLGLAAVSSLVLLLLGSYVHNLYISGWPLVRNTVFPDISNRYVAVHYLHRVAAAIGFIYLAYLAFAAIRKARPQVERWLLYGATAAYAVNIGLGAAHVFTKVGSSALVAIHLALATIVWTLLVGATAATALDGRRVEPPAVKVSV